MASELQVYHHDVFGDMRAVPIDGDPWFIGKDAATLLGYRNPREAILEHVDDEDKLNNCGTFDGVANRCPMSEEANKYKGTRHSVPVQDALGRVQYPVLINEGGLYSLVFSSKLPAAKVFKRWVTHEVIPAIRKHGMYVHQHATLDNLVAYKAETARMREETAAKKADNARFRTETNKLRTMLDRLPKKQMHATVAALITGKLSTEDVINGKAAEMPPPIEAIIPKFTASLAETQHPSLEKYLNTPLPPNWEELTINERRRYLANPDKSGTVTRRDVCSYAVWCECYGQQMSKMTKMDARAIAHDLSDLGWASHGIERKHYKPYGRQRIYIKRSGVWYPTI